LSNATVELVLEPMDNPRLANLCGPLDEHLRQLERGLGVEIHNRGNHFQIKGPQEAAAAARELLDALYREAENEALTRERVHLGLLEYGYSERSEAAPAAADAIQIRTKRGVIRGRSPHQQQYLRSILAHDINFGIGPAGTGKTYLAVACAVHALETDRVRRLILVRPAVEAGEKLGFLPGDLAQKVDPYLRPLYDALYEMLGFESVARLVERNVIEVAPLAYMRGRTLNESFIILDEAQNTTTEQMKMFLTRIGFGSIAVVTGDVTQVDLPRQSRSGLRHAAEVLRDVPGISFTWFANEDVVRHPLVQRIVRAYESHEGQENR
jgi:phosphate starvation-inducible protein PhoH and related proteins